MSFDVLECSSGYDCELYSVKNRYWAKKIFNDENVEMCEYV